MLNANTNYFKWSNICNVSNFISLCQVFMSYWIPLLIPVNLDFFIVFVCFTLHFFSLLVFLFFLLLEFWFLFMYIFYLSNHPNSLMAEFPAMLKKKKALCFHSQADAELRQFWSPSVLMHIYINRRHRVKLCVHSNVHLKSRCQQLHHPCSIYIISSLHPKVVLIALLWL